MNTRLLSLLPVFTVLLLSATEPLRLENGKLSLRFNPENGNLETVSGNGTVLNTSGGNQYNIQTKEDRWLFPEQKSPFTLNSHTITEVPNGKELAMTLSAPGWLLEVYTRLFNGESVFSRRIVWHRLEGPPVPVKAFRMSLDGLTIGKASDCTVIHPGHWPPRDTKLTGKLNRQMSATYRNHMPGAVLYNAKLRAGISVTMQTFRSDYQIRTIAGNGSAQFQTEFNIRTTMKKGDRAESGEELISVTAGTLRNAFASLPEAWRLNGFRLRPRPQWTDGAVLYSAYVQGTTWSRGTDIGTFDEFRTGVLPHLQQLGISILWFNPFNQGRYGVYSYEMEPEIGTEADLKRLCEEAEKMGIRVLMDLIPHGPSCKKSPYGNGLGERIIKEHPEWISRNSDGSFKRWWGGWCMDYANPGWQDEMCKLAGHYIKTCGISGWRVDCARYSPDNEQPTGGRIPSQSGTEGAITMMRHVHNAINKLRPDSILLGETRTTPHLSQMEFIYDSTFGGEVLPRLTQQKPEQWVPLLKQFLDRDEAAMPSAYASGLMRYSENHDTATALRRYGSGHRDSLLALTFLIPGLPLVNMDQEQGAGQLIAKLAEIRKRPEFIRGEAVYGTTGSSDPAVLTFTRRMPEQFSAVAINFTGQRKAVTLTLPPECGKTTLPFRELLHGISATRNSGELRFELEPYGTGVFAFSTANAPRLSRMPEQKLSAPEQKASLLLKNKFWTAGFRNGFPVFLKTGTGVNMLAEMCCVSDHFAIRDGKGTDYSAVSDLRHTLTREGNVQTLSFTGKWKNGRTFRASYTLDGELLNVHLENDPRENAALELSFGTDLEEWFVSALEGALRDRPSSSHPRGDEFRLVEQDLWLRNIRITHLLQKSGVHWQADAQPLDPLTGQLAFRKGTQWTGIRFTQEERALLNDLVLRENGSRTAGTTLRLSPEKGSIRFRFRANDRPVLPSGRITGKDWSLRTDGSRHTFRNPFLEMTVSRNEGGGISGLVLPDSTPLFHNSRIYSDDGFFTSNYDPEFGKYSPCPGSSQNNKESAMRIRTDRETLLLEFGGELKRDARLGTSALPKTAYTFSCRLNGTGRIGLAATVTPQPRPGLKGTLNWEFQLSRETVSVTIQTEQGEKTFKNAGIKKDGIIWNSAEIPLRNNGTITFHGKGKHSVWSMENIRGSKLRGLTLRSTAKGLPVFRAIFFDGDGANAENRGFECDLVIR